MTVKILIDTEILGPTRSVNGIEVRDVIARVATALEGADTPTERQLKLLQPWLWSPPTWKAWLSDPQNPASIEPIKPPAPNADLAALRKRIAEPFKADPPEGKVYSWRERLDDADEDPDAPDHLHWPEVLADMAQWPGLLPYHLQLCFAFTIPAAELAGRKLFLQLAAFVVDGGDATFDASAIDPDRLTSTSTDGGSMQESLAASPPGPRAPEQVLDLQRMLIQPRAGGLRQDEDWQQSLPDHLAGYSNPAAWLPALLRGLWSSDAASGSAMEGSGEPSAEHKQLALAVARLSHERVLQRLLSAGPDGNPAYGWLLDLRQSDDTALADSAGHCAQALQELAPDVEQWAELARSIDKSHQAQHPWPDAAQVDSTALIEAIDTALQARLSDLAILDRPLRLLDQLRPDLQEHVARLRQWGEAFERSGRSSAALLASEPPRAALALMRSWLNTPLIATTPVPAPPQLGYWRNYLDAVARIASGHPALDDWSAHIAGPEPGDQSGSPLARIVTAWLDLSPPDPPAGWKASWHATALGQLIQSLGSRPDSTRLTNQLNALQLTVDRPASVLTEGVGTDLSSRLAGYVGLVRQRLGSHTSPWYPLNLARASIHLQPNATAIEQSTELDLALALAPQAITYVDDQRRLLQCFDGTSWVDDVADRALGEDFGVEQDDKRIDTPLGLAMSYQRPQDAALPTLKDGVDYDFALLLMGAGNALHPDLRSDSGHPADLDPTRLAGMAVPEDAIHSIRAHRTLRVGAPQLRSAANTNPWHDQRQSGVVPLTYERIRAARAGRIPIPGLDKDELETLSNAPLSLLVPDSSWAGQTEHGFAIEPPQLSQSAWLRWWDRTRLEAADDDKPSIENHIQLALRMALKQAEEATLDGPRREPPGFDDPAVAGYVVSVRCLFDGVNPAPKPEEGLPTDSVFVPISETHEPNGDIDSRGRWAMRPLQRATLEVAIASNENDPLLDFRPAEDAMPPALPKPPAAVLRGKAGHVYALTIRAAVAERHFAGTSNQEARFVAGTEIKERYTHGELSFRLFAPARMLLEVAIDTMPTAEELWHRLCPHFDKASRRLRVNLACEEDAASPPSIAYADRHRLRVQRWNWRGRPVPEHPGPDAPESGWIDTLFDGRSAQDAQEIERRATANGEFTRLYDTDLSDDDRADVWRFGLVSESRYAAIAPRPLQVTATSAEGASRFKPLVIRQRGARPMPRPKVGICLPLMREVPVTGADDASERLAFLVELDEGWHEEAGPAERFHAEVVQTAHYDQIEAEPESLPEIAPLPYFSADTWPVDGTAAQAAPLQTLAVYGQTLDPDSGAARYSRASAIVTLSESASAAAKARWDEGSLLLKARFGRRVIQSLDHRDDVTRAADNAQWSADYWIELPPPSNRIGPCYIEAPPNASSPPGPTQPVATPVLRLQALDGGKVQLVTVSGTAPASTGPVPLRLNTAQMPRPYAWLILTEEVTDARGQPGGERLLDVQLLEANTAAPPWNAQSRPIERLRGYVYWLEPQRLTAGGPESAAPTDPVYRRPAHNGIAALKDLFEPMPNSADARVRIVQFSRAIRA